MGKGYQVAERRVGGDDEIPLQEWRQRSQFQLVVKSPLPELREICDASELLRECPDAMLVPVPANEFNDLLSSSIIL